MTERRLSRGAVVAGILFIALGVGVLLDETGAIDLQFSLLLPAALILGGVALLVTAWPGSSE